MCSGITAYPRRRAIRWFAARTAACARSGGIRVLHADDADGARRGLAPSREGHGRLHVMLAVIAGAGASAGWSRFSWTRGIRAEHHVGAERVEGRAWCGGRGTLGQPGGVALARGRHWGLFVRGDGAASCDVDVDVVRAADS